MRIRHDMKRIPRATLPSRSARRIANAQRAVEADKEACGFFPELAKFQTAEERLDHIDAVEMRRWQLFRDYEASSGGKSDACYKTWKRLDVTNFCAFGTLLVALRKLLTPWTT